jgi:hypothetical protein
MAVGVGSVDLSPSEAIDSVSSEVVDEAFAGVEAPEDAAEVLTSGDDAQEIVEDESGLPEDTEVEAQSEEVEGEDEDSSSSKPSKNSAQERIRKLVSERNQLTERFEQREAAFARQLQAIQQRSEQQYQAHLERLEAQNQLLQERLDSQRLREEREEFEKLPLKDQIERQVATRVQSHLEKLVNEKVGAVEKLLHEERENRRIAEEQFKRQQRIGELQHQANDSRSVLFKNMDPKEVGEWGEVIDDMFLGYAGGKGLYPKDAAPVFRKALESFARSYMKSLAKTNKEQIVKSKGIPASGGAKKSGSAKGVKTTFEKPQVSNGRIDPDEIFDHFAKQALS